MRRVVFYSWQSDLPNATNRSFIQQALERAAKAITADDTIDVDPVIDRDTQGVAGAPDIAKTIFGKIQMADVFVADVSIIGGRQKGRPTPNPKVLIELGYALNALGEEVVVLVFNTAYGRLDQLPFDLKMRRAIPYKMPESAADRASERKALEGRLDNAIRAALRHPKRGVAGSIRDLDSRVAKHKAFALPKLENVPEFGHVGVYCLPYGSVGVGVKEVEQFAAQHRHEFSDLLRDCVRPTPFQTGISFEYRAFRANTGSTAAITLYRHGLVALDAQADLDVGKRAAILGASAAKTLNPYWLSYQIQRQLQLAKAILSSHGALRFRTIVELDHIGGLSLLDCSGLAPTMSRKHQYGGSHEPIMRDIDLSDIHDYNGPRRNVVMPAVLEIMDEVCGMFSLSAAPSDVTDEGGTLTYVKGMENQR